MLIGNAPKPNVETPPTPSSVPSPLRCTSAAFRLLQASRHDTNQPEQRRAWGPFEPGAALRAPVTFVRVSSPCSVQSTQRQEGPACTAECAHHSRPIPHHQRASSAAGLTSGCSCCRGCLNSPGWLVPRAV